MGLRVHMAAVTKGCRPVFSPGYTQNWLPSWSPLELFLFLSVVTWKVMTVSVACHYQSLLLESLRKRLNITHSFDIKLLPTRW